MTNPVLKKRKSKLLVFQNLLVGLISGSIEFNWRKFYKLGPWRICKSDQSHGVEVFASHCFGHYKHRLAL